MLGPILRGIRGHRAAAALVIVQLAIGIAITVLAVLIGDYFMQRNAPAAGAAPDVSFAQGGPVGDGVVIGGGFSLHAIERDLDRIGEQSAYFLDAGPRIVAVAGFTLVAGRDFTQADMHSGAAIVTESLRLPVGAQFVSRARGPSHVVGVIADAPGYLLGEQGVIYARVIEAPHPLVLHRGGTGLADHIRANSASIPSVLGVLASMVGTIIVVIIIGSMGLTYFLVSRRTREIGMRRALGAKRRDIVGYFVLENLVLTIAAVALGLGLVALLVPTLFYEQEGFQIRWSLVAVATLVISALNVLATWIPARKAAAVPPVVASRAA